MLSKLLLIYLITIWSTFVTNIKCVDPDLNLCNDFTLDGAVVADDDQTYLFKNEYYWQWKALDSDSGLMTYGKLIVDKWFDIKSKFKIVFTLQIEDQKMTVFVVNNQWFGYTNGLKVNEGSVNSWPEFQKLSITSAFTSNSSEPLVYMLYSENNYYILYNFSNINKPQKLRSWLTTTQKNFLIFLDDTSNSRPGQPLKSLMNVMTALTYKDKLILLSKQKYCIIDMKAHSFEKECIPHDINKLLNCSEEYIKGRPSNAQIANNSVSTIIDLLSNTTNDNFSESVTEERKQLIEEIITGITILATDSEEEMFINSSSSPLNSESISDIITKRKTKQMIWSIIFIVGLITVSVIILCVTISVFRVKKTNKTKGKVYYI